MTRKGEAAEAGMIITAQDKRSAVELRVITGIVGDATENTIVVKNDVYDVTGVPVLDLNGEAVLERGSALCGMAAAILYRNGQVMSVKVFPIGQ